MVKEGQPLQAVAPEGRASSRLFSPAGEKEQARLLRPKEG